MRVAEGDHVRGHEDRGVVGLTGGEGGMSRLDLVWFGAAQGKPDIVHDLGGETTGPALFWDVVSPGDMVDLEFGGDTGKDALEEVVNDDDVAPVVTALGDVANGI